MHKIAFYLLVGIHCAVLPIGGTISYSSSSSSDEYEHQIKVMPTTKDLNTYVTQPDPCDNDNAPISCIKCCGMCCLLSSLAIMLGIQCS